MYLLEVRHSPPFLLLCTLDNKYVTGFAKIIPKGTRSEINNILKCDSYTNYLAKPGLPSHMAVSQGCQTTRMHYRPFLSLRSSNRTTC